MLNEKAYKLGASRSVIRELYEYGKKLKAEKGENAVFDFSIGNPTAPPPEKVGKETIKLLSENESIHAYTSAQGDGDVRRAIAEYLNKTFSANYEADGILLTCGAAASLCTAFKALVSSPEDEIIVFRPYFPEYKVFIEGAGGKCAEVGFDEKTLFPDLDGLKSRLSENTCAVVVNSPNNPTGLVYPQSFIDELAGILSAAEKKYGKTIYLISDEPYRDILFDGVSLPFIPRAYRDVITCYSYSKCLSLPGERIGYISVIPTVSDYEALKCALLGAARIYGHVCAPSLFQRVVANCAGMFSDTKTYKTNRDILYKELSAMGYECYLPHGAFYLFVKAPGGDDAQFSEKAKKLGLLVVPAESFGAKGYLRIATCVDTKTVLGALPIFAALAPKNR